MGQNAFAAFQPVHRYGTATMLTVAAAVAAIAFVAGTVGTWTWVVVVLAGCFAFGAGLLAALGPGVALVATLGTIEFLIASSVSIKPIRR